MHTLSMKLQMRQGGYKQHRIINSARGLESISFVEHSSINKIYCNDLTCYFEVIFKAQSMAQHYTSTPGSTFSIIIVTGD